MATELETNDARVRMFDALTRFLDALADLAGPLARMLRQELDDRAADAAKRGGRS